MKVGVRNEIEGTVMEIKRGSVMCLVKVKIAGGNVVSSVMTLESLKDLGIKKGSNVKVLIKAISVLLAVD